MVNSKRLLLIIGWVNVVYSKLFVGPWLSVCGLYLKRIIKHQPMGWS